MKGFVISYRQNYGAALNAVIQYYSQDKDSVNGYL